MRDTLFETQTDLSPSEIDAIVSLLVDGDKRTDDMLTAQLLERPYASRAVVVQRARAAGVWVEGRLHRVVRLNRREQLADAFAGLPRDAGGQVDLEAAAFLVARLEMPAFDEAACRRQLNEWADDVRMAMATANGGVSGLDALSAVLFRRLGFHGEEENYFNPLNSCLPHVMETRVGLPIALCVVALLIARRLGLPLHGVAMPGHFLLRYDVPEGPVYLDAFPGGELLTEAECLERQRAAGRQTRSPLTVARPTGIAVRMLRNLLRAYERLEDKEGAADALACMHAIVSFIQLVR